MLEEASARVLANIKLVPEHAADVVLLLGILARDLSASEAADALVCQGAFQTCSR